MLPHPPATSPKTPPPAFPELRKEIHAPPLSPTAFRCMGATPGYLPSFLGVEDTTPPLSVELLSSQRAAPTTIFLTSKEKVPGTFVIVRDSVLRTSLLPLLLDTELLHCPTTMPTLRGVKGQKSLARSRCQPKQTLLGLQNVDEPLLLPWPKIPPK